MAAPCGRIALPGRTLSRSTLDRRALSAAVWPQRGDVYEPPRADYRWYLSTFRSCSATVFENTCERSFLATKKK